MKVLVTSGAGYIGATAVRSLLASGHEVMVYDNLSRGYREAIPAGVVLIEGDIADRSALDSAFAEHLPEAVLHFAGFIEAGESMRFPEKYFRNNSAATLTLLEAMLANRILKLIFSSTAALYGEPERTPIQETDTLSRPTHMVNRNSWSSRCSPGFIAYTDSVMRVCATSMPPVRMDYRARPMSRSHT